MRAHWFCFAVACTVIAANVCLAQVDDQSKSGVVHFQYKTLHLKNDKIFAIEKVVDESAEPEKFEVEYTVMVPVKKDGVQIVIPQTRTRIQMKKPMINRLVEIKEANFDFLDRGLCATSKHVGSRQGLSFLQ